MAIVENPFGAPVVSQKQKLKKFLFVITKEMGLYTPYNTDQLVKAYNYCREQLGDEFEQYLKAVRKNIRRQEPSKEGGKVAINYLTDVFTKFPQIIRQLKAEGHWGESAFPDGWALDQYGLPHHPDYRLISTGALGYTYVHNDANNDLPPLLVVYDKNKKVLSKIENLKTGEVLWSGKKPGENKK